ncbi:hypothetical protein YC2023_002805 [Brassica napus]
MENIVLMTNTRPDHPDCTHFPLFFLAETLIDEIIFSSCSKSIRNQVRRITSLLQKAFDFVCLLQQKPSVPSSSFSKIRLSTGNDSDDLSAHGNETDHPAQENETDHLSATSQKVMEERIDAIEKEMKRKETENTEEEVEKEGKNNAKTEPRAEIEEEVQKESEEEVQKEEELNEGKEIEEEPEHADKVEKEARIYMEEEKKR